MPVPTNVSPKSNPTPNSVTEHGAEMETTGALVREALLPSSSTAKESMILVQVNHGETFTIQAENSIQCIEGPAQVPMVSPNGAIPPIQVPQGYISQVIEDQHGLRRVVVTPENQPLHFPGAPRVSPAVHLMSTMSHIPLRPGACYNYMQQSGVPGSQPTSGYPPSNHSNFLNHGIPLYSYTRPEGVAGTVKHGPFHMLPLDSDEIHGAKVKDRMPPLSPEAPQYHSLLPASSPSQWLSSSGPNSSPSTLSLSPKSAPSSPQKTSENYMSACNDHSIPNSEGLDFGGPSTSNNQSGSSESNNADDSQRGLRFDPMRVQSATNPGADEVQCYGKRSESSFLPAQPYQRPFMPEGQFDLKTYLSAISKPEIVALTPRSVSMCWRMQYSPPIDAKWDVGYAIYLMTKTKDGGKFRAVKRENSEFTELKDLKPGIEYHAKVLAETNSTQGAYSEVTTFKTPSCPPSTPAAPKMTHRTKNSLVLKWTAPNENGEKIFKYLLEWDEGEKGSGFRSLYSDSQKQYKVDKLRPSRLYTFRISCQNAMGTSPWSPEVTYNTSGAAPPAPDPPMLIKSFVQSLALQWVFPQSTRVGQHGYGSDPKFILEMDDGKGYGFRVLYDGPDVKYTATGLTKSSPYRFRLRAYNDDGKSGFSSTTCYHTSPDKPSPPGKVSLRGKAHSTYFKVSWDEPADCGGSEIEEYVLEYSLAKGQKMHQLYRGSNTDFTISDAVPGATYRLRVFCVSKGGISMPSEVAFVHVPPVVPGQCQPPWLRSEAGPTVIYLQWGPPEYDGGSAICEYEVGMQQEDEEINVVCHGNQLGAAVISLKPAVLYKFALRAGNKAGMGRWSEFVELQTGPATPEAPLDLQTDHVSAKSIHLSWTEPPNNGSEITRYIVEYGGQESTMNCRETALSSTCCIHHLTPNHLYFLRVQCENEVGKSPFSDVISVKTAPTCPGCITKIWQIDIPVAEEDLQEDEPEFYSFPTSATSVLIQWEKPLDFGSEITGYHIEICPVKSPKDKSPDDDGSALITVGDVLMLHIEELMADREYRVRVRAVNAVGFGQFSPLFAIRTQPLPPEPPVLECIPSSTSLKLKWSSADSGNTHKLQMLDKHGRSVTLYHGSNKSYKVVKLEEKTEYVFRISAQNDAGEGPFSESYSFFTTATQPPQLKNCPSVSVREDRALISWESVGTIKGDPVSYIVNIKDLDSSDIQQVTTDESDYLLKDLRPGVGYAVQVAILRHSKTKSKCIGVVDDKADFIQDGNEPVVDGRDMCNVNETASHQEDEEVYDDVTGPFTPWVNFKLKEETTDSPSQPVAVNEGSTKMSSFLCQIHTILNDFWVKRTIEMMSFFVLAFIFAYVVQFFVD